MRRVANLFSWGLLGLAAIDQASAARAADPGESGAATWTWVGNYWSVPPPGSVLRFLVPDDPTRWPVAAALNGTPAPTADRPAAVFSSGGDAAVDAWSQLGFRPDGARRALGRRTELDWGQINSKVVLADP